jgi:hypothetical protein
MRIFWLSSAAEEHHDAGLVQRLGALPLGAAEDEDGARGGPHDGLTLPKPRIHAVDRLTGPRYAGFHA